uniref:Tyr recombinase domain-containing protein n=1 Tax=Macrostomum lignano TaxID=282301 RepID=A0A1I8H629_9PLAT
ANRKTSYDSLRKNSWLNKSGFSACQRLGKDSLGDFMKNLSACLALQRKYTNHCVRVTTVNCLAKAGFDNQAITLMTGHKNSSSVDVYKRRDMDCVARMSACLAAYGSKVTKIDDDAESTIESVTTGSDRGELMKAPEDGQDLPRSLCGGQFHNCTFNFYGK